MIEPCRILPFLNGVYLGVDAVPGSFLIVDGPYCVSTKAEMQFCHNLASGLIRPLGRSAVAHTAQSSGMEEVAGLATDRLAAVERLFGEVCSEPEARVVLATSFDFHELLNFPLREIAASAARRWGKPVLFIPSASLGGNWLDGYARFCETLAEGIPLKAAKPEPRTAAVVGYLFDRGEPDHAGNLRELRRLFGALGWRLSSVWLSGEGPARLGDVAKASVLVSLPYGRGAARVLARRLGRRLVEADLPVGLGGTEGFLKLVGRGLGSAARASDLIGRERRLAVRDTELHVQRVVRGRLAIIEVDDPFLGTSLEGLCSELGLVVRKPPVRTSPDFPPVLFCSSLSRGGDYARVLVGYPNYADHPVLERPSLGYAGFRHLVDRIVSAVLSREAEAACSARPAAA